MHHWLGGMDAPCNQVPFYCNSFQISVNMETIESNKDRSLQHRFILYIYIYICSVHMDEFSKVSQVLLLNCRNLLDALKASFSHRVTEPRFRWVQQPPSAADL